MKFKFILAGNGTSRDAFLASLKQEVKLIVAAESVLVLGSGTYKFRLGSDDIEIMNFASHPKFKKNYKRHCNGAKGIIFANADAEMQVALRSVCDKSKSIVAGYSVTVRDYNSDQSALDCIKNLIITYRRDCLGIELQAQPVVDTVDLISAKIVAKPKPESTKRLGLDSKAAFFKELSGALEKNSGVKSKEKFKNDCSNNRDDSPHYKN